MIRKARLEDVASIHKLINAFAKQDLMMPRSLNDIYENIRDYWVAADAKERLLGCAGLHIVGWDNLAEIKSLAVEERRQGSGLGRRLVEACLDEARELSIDRVFALSYKPNFFKKFGFKIVPKSKLPHKVWAECCHCPKFPDCGEIALIKTI
jgi:amino-acid N-acetyltransferase